MNSAAAILGGAALLIGVVSPGLRGADGPDAPVIVPLPAVAGWARAHAAALDQFAVPAGILPAGTGDAVTFLVSLRDGRAEQQWLVELQIANLTAAERAAMPQIDSVFRSAGGPEVRFSASRSVALEVRTTGPFSAAPPRAAPPTSHARALISPDFLGLGLDQSCRAWSRFLKDGGGGPKAKPMPADISPETLRALLGCFQALGEFFEVVQRTPGMHEILWAVVDRPSIWSILRHAGRVNPNIIFDGTSATSPSPVWRRATRAEVYRMPLALELNQRPALRCALYVTAPAPPLLACAGIIGVDATPPSRPETRLAIRLVASRRAAPDGN